MKTKYKNKSMDSEAVQTKAPQRRYFYPEHKFSVLANSKAEADEMFKKKFKPKTKSKK